MTMTKFSLKSSQTLSVDNMERHIALILLLLHPLLLDFSTTIGVPLYHQDSLRFSSKFDLHHCSIYWLRGHPASL